MTNVATETSRRPNPFENMKIQNNSFLKEINDRSPCTKCHKSRKFFCYTCYIPVARLTELLPKVIVSINILNSVTFIKCFNFTASHTN